MRAAQSFLNFSCKGVLIRLPGKGQIQTLVAKTKLKPVFWHEFLGQHMGT
jgi:hypothetical protein